MSVKQYPTIEYLRQCFRYDKGELRWLERPRSHFITARTWKTRNTRNVGKTVGHLSKREGRYMVRVGGHLFMRSRIVWILHHDTWPSYQLDHINRDKKDDRIENLREATHSQNQGNILQRADNTSGYRGVTWFKSTRRWKAQISINGKRMGLGYFSSAEEAFAAYKKAATKYWGEYAATK